MENVNIEDSVNALAAVIRNECSYDSMGKDGRLVNPGKLLAMHGAGYGFSIRDKYWDVYEHNNEVWVDWETQSTPIAPAVNMLRDAVIKAGLCACTVVLNIWDRDGEEEINEVVNC